MKKVKSKLKILAVSAITLTTLGLGSCSKSDNNGGTPPPTGPDPINGYVSSDSVAPGNLIAYWPFEGNTNDVQGGLVGTPVGVTYSTTGVRGKAYQGAAGAYSTAVPNAAFTGLASYSLSVWYNLPAQPTNPPNDPQGLFFLFSTNGNAELITEMEHYAPLAKDSVQVHAGFYNPKLTQWQGWTMVTYDTSALNNWVHFVMTYDGPSSTYVVYQNGSPTSNNSAFGWNLSSVLTAGPANADPASPPVGTLDFSTDLPTQIVIGSWPAGLYGISPALGDNGSFMGQIDELRVFNRALTPAEVSGLYGNGKAGR